MKAAWQGFITLGQLGFPVKLFQATRSIRPKFIQLHELDGSVVERLTYCRKEGKQISNDEIIRAVETDDGTLVTLSESELNTVSVDPLRDLNIMQFCNLDAIESILYEKPYYIVPQKGGERAYALLRDGLVRLNKSAIGTFVLYNKEYLAAIKSRGDLLMLYRMRFAAEIVPRSDIRTPALPKPTPQELQTISSVISLLSGPFYSEDFHDHYSEFIQALIERKKKGLKISNRKSRLLTATPENKIVDALEQSLGLHSQAVES